MAKLSDSNPYLKKDEARIDEVAKSVVESSAAEGIYLDVEQVRSTLIKHSQASVRKAS